MAAVEEAETVVVEGEIWEEVEIITFAIMAEGSEEITGGGVGETLAVIGMEEVENKDKEIKIWQVIEGDGRRKKKILYQR
mmetsp:Transcript_4205/g.6571  ORF Transcript_4205/g.6571 Transcript_4205/m.6571 type:complete len:80 (+) Transcript_4205:228-467(+)